MRKPRTIRLPDHATSSAFSHARARKNRLPACGASLSYFRKMRQCNARRSMRLGPDSAGMTFTHKPLLPTLRFQGRAMDFQLSEQQRRIIVAVRDLAQGEFKANAQKSMD